MRVISKSLLVIGIIGAVICLPKTLNTCAPEFPKAIFTRSSGPDKPMTDFAAGKIGIILPTWQRAYLAVACRYFAGKPLHKSEQQSLMEFWDDSGEGSRPPDDKAIEGWLNERSKHTKRAPPSELSQFKSSGFVYVSNCAPPAFRTATATLRDRVKKYGAGSPDLAEWISGQDAVFRNCRDGSVEPASLPETASPILRADRAYQIAAAHFYKGDPAMARREFDEIAKDKISPWHEIAPYMVARTWIRQAEEAAPKDWDFDPDILKDAEPVLQAILHDPHQSSMHHDAQRLLALVRYHAYPQQRLHELAALLSGDRSGGNFGQNLRDFTMMLNRTLDAEPDFPGVEHWGEKYDRLRAEWKLKRYNGLKQERSDELGDWLITFQSASVAAKEHAIARWRKHRSTPWLAIAISKATGVNAATVDLVAAAAEVPSSSPAYATLAYHKARLEHEQGHDEAARRTLADALTHRADLPLSTVNLLRDQMSSVADSLDAFTTLVGRTPVELSLDCDDWDEENSKLCAQYFWGGGKPKGRSPLAQIDPTTAVILNTKIPVSTYVQIARSEAIPENVRKRMLPTAWMRAALLNESTVAAAVAKDAVEAEPRLKRYIDDYSRAQKADEREFVAAFAILHFPGIRPFVESSFARLRDDTKIDDYRDNWWCADVGGNPAEINYYKQNAQYPTPRQGPAVDYPAFLSSVQKQQAAVEWKHLHSLGIAQRYLPRVVIAWAKTHPQDPRVPEALHYAERAVRYGCDDGKGNLYGRDVFRLLHKNYPGSEWARETRFW